MTPADAYKQITELAREHALVLQAVGGVVTICHPDVQREEGIYCQVQWVHGRGRNPEGCKCERDGKGACKSG